MNVQQVSSPSQQVSSPQGILPAPQRSETQTTFPVAGSLAHVVPGGQQVACPPVASRQHFSPSAQQSVGTPDRGGTPGQCSCAGGHAGAGWHTSVPVPVLPQTLPCGQQMPLPVSSKQQISPPKQQLPPHGLHSPLLGEHRPSMHRLSGVQQSAPNRPVQQVWSSVVGQHLPWQQ